MSFSWWNLGEGSGQSGQDLNIGLITCAFCLERGKFSTEHHAEKRKPNSSKVLNFDTLRCANCGGYVLVLWSASEFGMSFNSLHDFKVLPWPQKLEKSPDHWPPDVGRFWLQAHRSLDIENWDAAVLMGRSALQAAVRTLGASGRNLRSEIDDLSAKGELPNVMKDWAHEVRELGNDSAHPTNTQSPPSSEDARDIVRFLDYMCTYLFSLPHEISKYRERKGGAGGA